MNSVKRKTDTNVAKRARRAQAGSALTLALVMASLMILTLMALSNVAVTSVRMAAGGYGKAAALGLAEAGVDDTLDRLRANDYYLGNLGSPVTLKDDAGADVGSYEAEVRSVPSSSGDLVDIFSTGTAASGRRVTIRARVSMSGTSLPGAAILGNGPINISGGPQVLDNSGANSADVVSNGFLSVGGNAVVQGELIGGTGYSVQSGASPYPPVAFAPPVLFPSTAQKQEWQADWIARAKAGGEMNAGAVRSMAAANPPQPLTGPKYISGDLVIDQNDHLILQGDGPIYVNGRIELKSKAKLTNPTLLVCTGTFSMGSQNDYIADHTINPANPPALVSFSTDMNQAITIGAQAQAGVFSVVYALNGGVKVTAGATMTAQLIAGGKDAQISSTGQFVQRYPGNIFSKTEMAGDPVVINYVEY